VKQALKQRPNATRATQQIASLWPWHSPDLPRKPHMTFQLGG
jgi:hypothetical protein